MVPPIAFAGSIPELYDRHLAPVMFEPYAREVARRVPPGASRVLEVAAGTGRVTRHLVAGLPAGGELVATDAAGEMIAWGARLVGSDPRLSWGIADAQALPFGDAAFDLAVCQFGLMFVADPDRAARELRRVVRPGGTLLLGTWDAVDANPATGLLHDLAAAAFPDGAPAGMLVPFAMCDVAALRRRLVEAGFADVRVETIRHAGEAVSAADFAIGLVRGNPLWNELVAHGVDAAAFERTVAGEVARRFGDRPCRVPMAAHLATAVA